MDMASTGSNITRYPIDAVFKKPELEKYKIAEDTDNSDE